MLNGDLSLSDIAAVTGNNNGALGGDGWWVLIILFALFGGWGNNGMGGGQVGDNYVLASDMSQLSRAIADSAAMTERKLDGVNNGLCSGFYQEAQLVGNLSTNMLTGFNTTQAAIKDCCCQTQQNIADVKYAIGSTGADISRGVERGFSDTNYNIANQANMLDRTVSDKFCQTNFNNATNTRDIIDSQNAGTRAIIEKLCQMENNAKDEKIAELQAKNFDLRLAASQEAQNRVLISELGYQCPKPAYVVQPPQQVSFATNCAGVATLANTGCGCNQYYGGTTIA